MATDRSQRKETKKNPPDVDATQAIPLVEANGSHPYEEAPAAARHVSSENGAIEEESAVPQETVPMPVATWPPVQLPPESPTKPPPLRESGKDTRVVVEPARGTGSLIRYRTGLLTGELRRALPPWALPLLTSQPVSVWLAARISLTVLAFLVGLMIPGLPPKGTANWYGSPGGPFLNGFIDRIGGVWTRWDGQWYLKIATQGYHRDDGTAAFFPLYPWLVQITGWLAAERYIWAGILLSSVFFLGALILLHRLVRLDFHPDDASRTVFYTAAFPMAFFFWAVYSESLFLLLAVTALLAARTQRWWWSGVAIAFAIWTRSTGLLLVLPLCWELWRAYHPRVPTDPHAMPPARPPWWSPLSLALPAVSLAGFLIWAGAVFGKPLASLAAQTDWNRHFTWPWVTAINAVQEAGRMPFQFQPENQSWTYLAALVLALLLGALSIKWLRGSYSIYLWAGIIFPLFSATPHNPLLSYPRFLVVLFPMFMVLALLGRNRYAHQIILWTGMVLLALFTMRFANWYWVA